MTFTLTALILLTLSAPDIQAQTESCSTANRTIVRHRTEPPIEAEQPPLAKGGRLRAAESGGLGRAVGAGGPEENKDSIRYRAHAVLVIASRMPFELATAPVGTEVLGGDALSHAPVSCAADALRGACGTDVKPYGGAGSLQTFSVRGLGPEYAVVLMNGIRINDAQSGVVDLGRISLQNVERIEVARGGFAALYGADALGGVVNIRTNTAAPRTGARVSLGSFGSRGLALEAGDRGALGRVQICASYEESANDFRFTPMHDVSAAPVVRTSAGYIRRLLSGEALASFGASTLTLYALAGSNDAGVPGAYTQAVQGRARQRDDDVSLAASLRTQLAPHMLLTVSPTIRNAVESYSDPQLVIGGAALDSRYDNLSGTVAATLDADLALWMRIVPGMEAGLARLRSADVRGVPRRITASAFISAEITPVAMLRVYPALRADALRESPDARAVDAVSPSLGMHAALLPGLLSLRAQAARGFRAPTFNQLYWAQGGNPALRPEYSTAVDAGVTLTPCTELSRIDAGVFHHDITDKIVWMPGAGLWWTPKNLQHVVSEGVECSAEGRAFSGLVAWRAGVQRIVARKMNSSFANDATAGKRLVYTPDYSASASVDVRAGAWLRIAVSQYVCGARFTTEDNDAARALPAYAVTDIAATARLPFAGAAWEFKAELLNAFDASYEAVAYYPMPPRSFRFTLSTHIFDASQDTP